MLLQEASAAARIEAKTSGLEGKELGKHTHKLLVALGKQRARECVPHLNHIPTHRLMPFRPDHLTWQTICVLVIRGHKLRQSSRIHIKNSACDIQPWVYSDLVCWYLEIMSR